MGRTFRSDGILVTYRDWRSNRLVDQLAKAAALRRRTPQSFRDLLDDAFKAVEYSAACLGVVTHAANNFRETAWRADGSACAVVHRDAQPPAFLARGTGQRPKATGKRKARSCPPPLPPASSEPHLSGEQLLQAQREHQKTAKARMRQAAVDIADSQEVRAMHSWYLGMAAASAARAAPPASTSAPANMAALAARIRAKSLEGR